MDCSALLQVHLSDVTKGNNMLGARLRIMGFFKNEIIGK